MAEGCMGNPAFCIALTILGGPFYAAYKVHEQLESKYPTGSGIAAVLIVLLGYGIYALAIYGLIKLFPAKKEEREYFKRLPETDENLTRFPWKDILAGEFKCMYIGRKLYCEHTLVYMPPLVLDANAVPPKVHAYLSTHFH